MPSYIVKCSKCGRYLETRETCFMYTTQTPKHKVCPKTNKKYYAIYDKIRDEFVRTQSGMPTLSTNVKRSIRLAEENNRDRFKQPIDAVVMEVDPVAGTIKEYKEMK